MILRHCCSTQQWKVSCQLWASGLRLTADYGGLRKGRAQVSSEGLCRDLACPVTAVQGRRTPGRKQEGNLRPKVRFQIRKTVHTPKSSSHLYAQYTVCWVLPCPISCGEANCEKKKNSERVKMKNWRRLIQMWEKKHMDGRTSAIRLWHALHMEG